MTGIEHMVAQMSGTLPLPRCPTTAEQRVALTRPSVFKWGPIIEDLRADGMDTVQISQHTGLSRKSIGAYESLWRKVQ